VRRAVVIVQQFRGAADHGFGQSVRPRYGIAEALSARPATILRRRLASIFLNSQANYCVDKGRVTNYIPRCL
jgi:hypothetical protein